MMKACRISKKAKPWFRNQRGEWNENNGSRGVARLTSNLSLKLCNLHKTNPTIFLAWVSTPTLLRMRRWKRLKERRRPAKEEILRNIVKCWCQILVKLPVTVRECARCRLPLLSRCSSSFTWLYYLKRSLIVDQMWYYGFWSYNPWAE